ncbi:MULTISPECIES: colicin-like pore-forming protein [unclassified Pseudomonas]|uniref:colicin-like pore-forming protein n=1 Tax=unclassified Pseudomonas TaxID=196821 RepID=UPI0015A2CE86|nr:MULTISPECIES: colicin-like pore-forming protein [unclassified Pseudomonas]NWC96511.1 hypothetical protein [Pseudomonas sp. IPO3779]NWD20813.1 hypothetical protein [Pseudomonas sp. IPO3778]
MTQNTITLPPTVVTPDLPPFNPPILIPGSAWIPPFLTGGVNVPASGDVEAFFSKKGVQLAESTVSVVATIIEAQLRIEQSYLAYLPQLTTDIDVEIAAVTESGDFSELEIIKTEKLAVESLIVQATVELANSGVVAVAFFGRHPLGVEIAKSAVDFVNVLQTSRHSRNVALDIYKRWSESVMAAYRVKVLEEKIRILTEKSNALTLSIANTQDKEDTRIATEAEAKRLAEEQASVAAEDALLKSGALFLADINKDILLAYGERMSKVALGMQDNISGKKVRSYPEAMATFEQVRANPGIRLDAKDKEAVLSSLKILDQATLADNVTRLGKAFGVVGKIDQINNIREGAMEGVESGNWKPLGLELESIALGMGAGAVLAASMALLSPVFATTVAGVVIVAVMMALAAAYFDSEKVDEINTVILMGLNNT